MLKYYLIIGGILVSFFSDVIQKEKDDKNKSKLGLKKYTKTGRFILILGLLLSCLGVYQIISDDKENEIKVFLKAQKDSTILAKKNFNDSVRFMAIIKELSKNQNQVLTKTDNLLATTLEESQKVLLDGHKTKLTIPEQFYISFKAIIDIDQKNITEYETEIAKVNNKYLNEYNTSNNRNFNGALSLIPKTYNNQNFGELTSIFNLANGQIITIINFNDDYNKSVLRIWNNDMSKLNYGKPPFSKQEEKFNENKYEVYYDFKNKLFYLMAQRICLNSYHNESTTSLVDLKNKKIEVEIGLRSDPDFKQFRLKKIIDFKISTINGLGLLLNDFNKSYDNYNDIFTKKLSENIKW